MAPASKAGPAEMVSHASESYLVTATAPTLNSDQRDMEEHCLLQCFLPSTYTTGDTLAHINEIHPCQDLRDAEVSVSSITVMHVSAQLIYRDQLLGPERTCHCTIDTRS